MLIKPLVAAVAVLASSVAAVSHNSTQKEYDYVVVGSGAGGGTLAASLARKGHSVFLIEAGGDHGTEALQQIPLLGASAAETPNMSWSFFVRHYRNETQGRRDSKFSYRLPNGALYYGLNPPAGAEPLGTFYPRGATLGGSTQVNAQGFEISSEKDWEWLADFTRDDSWSATHMDRYFRQLENNVYIPRGTPGHGFQGPISASRNNISIAIDRRGVYEVVSSLESQIEGINVTSRSHLHELMQRDINNRTNSFTPGVYQDVVSVDATKRRSGTRNWVAETIAEGYPLTLSLHSLASKILFEQNSTTGTPRAYGLEYMVGDGLYAADRRYRANQTYETRQITAKKEVIIAAGAFNTPQLLMLSGLGPRAELERHQIPVVVDLPGVGQNLHDHTEAVVTANASMAWEDNALAPCLFALNSSDPCYVNWRQNGGGPYAEAAAAHAVRIRSSQSQTGEVDVWAVGLANAIARGFYPGYSNPVLAPQSWSWIMVKIHAPGLNPNNGSVTLRSSNPRDVPEIQFDWLQGDTGARDIAALTEGAEIFMRAWNDAPARYLPITRHQPPVGADVGQSFLDEAFGHHASSTCRMGPEGDRLAVVDSHLRVFGVKGLRIADASVFPYTPGAFPAMTFHLIGLKGADMVHADSGRW